MKTKFALTVSLFVMSLALTQLTGAQSGNLYMPIDSHRLLGMPFTHGNLTIYPVIDNGAPASSSYITLDEGLASGNVTVKEANGGDVNELQISNKGDRPIYVLAGEVILGGRQDRVFGRDYVVPPRRADLGVRVFCVEHGRWTGPEQFSTASKMVASNEIRTAAQAGAYTESSGGRAPINTRGGSAVQRPGVASAQQQVWDTVARKNANFGAAPSSQAYREVLELKADRAKFGIAPYLTDLQRPVANIRGAVGVVAVINGRIAAADIFGDRALFNKLWPKLLRSFAADAAEKPRTTSYKTMPMTKIRSFLSQASSAKGFVVSKTEASSSMRSDIGSTVMYKTVAPGSSPSEAIHMNYLNK